MAEAELGAWSRLPEDLTATILARLPVPNLLQVRTVCKKWESTIRSAPFLKLCSDLPARLPWYLGFHGFRHDQGWAYDLSSSRWHSIDFGFLPPSRCATAAGGLLCFCQDSIQGNSLYICNPMTKVWRALPRFPGCIKQVTMRVDAAKDTYTVVVFVQDSSAIVYRKNCSSWRELSPGLASHPQLNIVDAVFCGGVLYCLINCGTRDWQFIKAYDFEMNSWRDFGVPMPDAFQSSDLMKMTYLVDHRGRLLFVEKTIQSLDISASSSEKASKPVMKVAVGIHELDPATREWKNAASILENATLCIGSFTSRAVVDGGCQKLIYFTNHGSAVNVYDAVQDSWHRLPEFPRQRIMSNWLFRKPRCNLGVVIPFKGLWFDPRLDSGF